MLVLPVPTSVGTAWPAFSPAGRRLAVGGYGGLAVFPDLGRPGDVLAHRSADRPMALGFTPDGRRAVGHEFRGVFAVDPATGARDEVGWAGGFDEAAALSADGTALARDELTGGKFAVGRSRWDGAGYRPAEPLAPTLHPTGWLAYSADGRWLAGWRPNPAGVRVWRDPGLPTRAAFVGRADGTCCGLAVAADGGLVAAVVAQHARRDRLVGWDVRARAELFRRAEPGRIRWPAFHPRLPILATTDIVTRRMVVSYRDARSGRVVRRYDWGRPTGPLAFSPDGTLCAMASGDAVLVWDVD